MDYFLKVGQQPQNQHTHKNYYPQMNRNQYVSIDLHKKNEINLNLNPNEDKFYTDEEEDIDMLNRKTQRNIKEKISMKNNLECMKSMMKDELNNSDDMNFNMLKYNLSNQNFNNNFDSKMNQNNYQMVEQAGTNDYHNQYFQNNVNFFSNGENKKNVKTKRKLKKEENFNNNKIKNNNNNNNSFENAFIKELLLSKIQQILSSDNLQEKLMLYFIINNSDNFFKKCDEEKEKEKKYSTTMFNNNIFNNNNTNIPFNNNKNNISVQKDSTRQILHNFCSYLKESGYAVVTTNHKTKTNKESPNNDKYRDSFANIFVTEELENTTGNPKRRNSKKKIKETSQLKKAWLCPHIYRVHYARGKCQNCYLNFYHKVRI